MKAKLLPLLVGVAFAGSASAGTPVVYGRINVSLQKNDYEEVDTGAVVDQLDNWRLESNASRIGVKGDYDISDSLKAVYKLEYQIGVDNGFANGRDKEFTARNVAGGLQGSWGTVLFGRHDTPLKLIQEKVDRFNDLQLADIQNYLIGENRLDNILLYNSPSFSGFALTLAIAPGEESGVDGNDDNDGPADARSIALSYGLGTPLYIAIAHENNLAPNSGLAAGPGGSSDTTRLVVDYSIGPVKLGGIYQTAERHDSDGWLPNLNANDGAIGQFTGGNNGGKEQDAWVVNGEWSVTPQWVVKAQYGYSETTPINAALDDAEASMIAVGVDYKLDKNSRIFSYYASLEVEGDNSVASGSPTDKTFGVGYELNF